MIEGDTFVKNNHHFEVVGIRNNGYDVIRYADQKIFVNVSKNTLDKHIATSVR